MNMKATLSALAIGVVALSATANAQDAKTVKIAYSVDVLDDTQNAESGGAKVVHGSGGIMLLRAE